MTDHHADGSSSHGTQKPMTLVVGMRQELLGRTALRPRSRPGGVAGSGVAARRAPARRRPDPAGRRATTASSPSPTCCSPPTERGWLTTAALPREPLPRRPSATSARACSPPASGCPCSTAPPSRTTGRSSSSTRRGVRLHVDVFGSAFAMLTRYEEAIPGERDALRALPGRGGARRPRRLPADPARRRLRRAAARGAAAPVARGWPPPVADYRVLLSHDVDDPLSTLGRSRPLLARQLAGDVLRRRDPGLLLRRARALADARRGRLRPRPAQHLRLPDGR